MLPSNLLVVWKRKGQIQPRYAKFTDENLEVAKGLIEAYKSHVGEKKKVLKDFITELEDKGYEYRFVRGLSLLLDRRSKFNCEQSVRPADLRRRIFEVTEELGIPTDSKQRNRIIRSVASELKLTSETVEKLLYADLESELILEECKLPTPSDLLREYNLSLTQTLLFNSLELSFTASGNWQNIFYTVKKLGLIYEVYRENGVKVRIDGPAALFKLTRRYGTAIAKLLPAIIVNPQWSINGKILWKYTNEICDFKLTSLTHRQVLRVPRLPPKPFDSKVEEDFAKKFQALKSEWLLKREPEPVPAGKQVIIPDFSIEREGIRVYMEVVGFWTLEYLLRKIKKLNKIKENMLLLVNERLACEKLVKLEKRKNLDVIYYKNKIKLAPILSYLEETFKKIKAKETEFLKNLPVKFTEPMIKYKDFASRTGISTEAVREVLATDPPPNYVAMPNCLIKKSKLEKIRKKIEKQMKPTETLSLPQAVRIIEKEGVEDATSVLEELGYKILWRGINSEKAEVVKPKK